MLIAVRGVKDMGALVCSLAMHVAQRDSAPVIPLPQNDY